MQHKIYEISFTWKGRRRTDYVRALGTGDAMNKIERRYGYLPDAMIEEAHDDPSA